MYSSDIQVFQLKRSHGNISIGSLSISKPTSHYNLVMQQEATSDRKKTQQKTSTASELILLDNRKWLVAKTSLNP